MHNLRFLLHIIPFMYNLTPSIISIPATRLVGCRQTISMADYRVEQLWKTLMPLRSAIESVKGTDLISMAIYPSDYYRAFDPTRPFEKWAAVEVSDWGVIPEGLESFEIPAGQYAVFAYKGPAHDASIFQYIFSSWLPASGYVLDDRPHFERLGPKYRNHHPDSEEEIWIPVRSR